LFLAKERVTTVIPPRGLVKHRC